MSKTTKFGATGTLLKSSRLSETLSHKSVVEKQRAAIDKLRQQNAGLKEGLLLENKFSVRPSNPGATVLINKLQDEADLFTRKIQLERRKVLMLQQQLEQLQSKLGCTRTAMGGIFSAKEKTQALQKQIKILENRLEKQFIKYNEAITYNKQLREQIDNLRRERLMFEAINSNLDKDLARIKRNIADTITAANEAHAAKEKALSEVAVLKLAAEKEHAAFEEEWRQLSHIIEHDRRAREAARQNEMAEREQRTQELLKSCEASAANRKKAVRSTWSIGMNKALAQNVSHEKVRLFGEAFAKIQEATGIQDIDELVAAFNAAEDANYTLFNYVNEVNTEVEALEDNIGRVRQEIDAYVAQARASEASASAAAGSTFMRSAAAEAKADAYERCLAGAAGVVEQLRGGIGSLFETAGCNTDAVHVLLGGEQLSDANLLAHLGIIEQRTNEVLQAYALSKPNHPALAELLHAQPIVAAPGHRIVIEPPSTLEPLGGAAGPGQLGSSYQPAGLGYGSASLGLLDQQQQQQQQPGDGGAGGAAEEAQPDDVLPLTRTQLQAKVAKNLDNILERSLKVKPVGAGGSAARRK
uniref:ODAD1 central coiled coil region domain-containing protein n=1 Tax=Tetradesmus obliquus TaxID=3088 RepID=A0A383V6K0_TETOB|eukprot:jgi/Sobl393_1/15335/SZX60550.1